MNHKNYLLLIALCFLSYSIADAEDYSSMLSNPFYPTFNFTLPNSTPSSAVPTTTTVSSTCPSGTIQTTKIDQVSLETKTICAEPLEYLSGKNNYQSAFGNAASAQGSMDEACPDGTTKELVLNPDTGLFENGCETISSTTDLTSCLLESNPFDSMATKKCYLSFDSDGDGYFPASYINNYSNSYNDEEAQSDSTNDASDSKIFTAGGYSY